jgi:Peptidase family M28
MARKKNVNTRHVHRGRSIWIMIGLFLLGLLVGAGAGFFIHYYVINPHKKSAAKTKLVAVKKEAASAKSEKKYVQPPPSEPARVEQTMSYLSQQVGPRVEGTQSENVTATYLKTELEKMGYSVGWQQFTLPNGAPSQNLVTADPGQSDKYTFLISGHIDSRSGSPGANDDASGCAAVLELARTIKGTKHVPEIRFLLFGAEEDYGPKRTPKRIGSTYYLSTQPPEERAKIVGMLSADMISVGPEVHFRDWGPNSPGLAQALVAAAQAKGLNAFQDPSQESDHEPFGAAGIPAVWVERMLPGGKPDTALNTSSDNMAHVSTNLVTELVDPVRSYALGLDESSCKAAVAR